MNVYLESTHEFLKVVANVLGDFNELNPIAPLVNILEVSTANSSHYSKTSIYRVFTHLGDFTFRLLQNSTYTSRYPLSTALITFDNSFSQNIPSRPVNLSTDFYF